MITVADIHSALHTHPSTSQYSIWYGFNAPGHGPTQTCDLNVHSPPMMGNTTARERERERGRQSGRPRAERPGRDPYVRTWRIQLVACTCCLWTQSDRCHGLKTNYYRSYLRLDRSVHRGSLLTDAQRAVKWLGREFYQPIKTPTDE